jgi:uncharacterized protein (DUF1501 family)
MNLTRRAMMKDGLLAVSAGMIMPSVFARAVRAAQNAAREGDTWAQAAQGRTLIVVQMAGGNDGLNTIVPYTDPNYQSARPTLKLGADQVLDLNGRLGMHPGLQALQPLWKAHKLAVVEGVGYPNSSLSHFTAMDIWQTVDVDGQGRSGKGGWLGNYAKYLGGMIDENGHPFTTMAVGSTLPTALRALNVDVPVVSANPSEYRLQPDPANTKDVSAANARIQTLLKLYSTYPKSAPYAALLDATAQGAVAGSKQLADAVSSYTTSVKYPATNFAKGLQVLAEAIVQKLGLRVGYVTIGGFDTHAEQDTKTATAPGRHTELLIELAEGVAAFYADLAAHGAADNVVVMTWSEFGRRVHENGSHGTDHGTAAPLFVAGNAVLGGVYGEPPDLSSASLDHNGNLVNTVDFRSVYATVLDWLGAPSASVLGQSFNDQKFLPAG